MEPQVLSNATINRIADELLDQARTSKFGITDPSGIPVPHLYRCPDLARLPQGIQQEVVDRANREASASPLFLLSVLVSMLVVALLYFANATGPRHLPPYAFPVVVPLLPLLVRALLVRRAVRLIAQRMAAQWPVPVRV